MATQPTALTTAARDAQVKALSMKGEIVAYHQAATRAAEEAMENLFQCGRLLDAVKDALKADKTTQFGKWVEQFCGFSERSAQCYCKLHNDLRDLTKAQRAALFKEYQSQRSVNSFLADNRKTTETEPPMATPKPIQTLPMTKPDEVQSEVLPEYQDSYPSKFQKGTLGYVLDQEAGIEKTTEARKRAITKESGQPLVEVLIEAPAPSGSLLETARLIQDVIQDIRLGLQQDDDKGDRLISAATDRLDKYGRTLRILAGKE